jgi:NADPH:quinone reductase-like Zn-dependent oxidoreductase
MITWEPSTSVIVAPARSAMERTTSAPAALPPLATTAHDGRFFQAGSPFGSENATSATGRWVAEFSGKVVVVAGGAQGIGRAAARKLALADASVVICSDREDQVNEAVAELRVREGLEVSGTRADVASSADMKRLMDFATETYGGVDVLINSAGIQRYGTVVARTPSANASAD